MNNGAFTILVLMVATAASSVAQQIISSQGLVELLSSGVVRNNAEVLKFGPLPAQPSCFAAYFDTPSWTNAKISVRAADNSACTGQAVRWKAVVEGPSSWVPPSLHRTVGFRGSLTSSWQGDFSYKSQAAVNEQTRVGSDIRTQLSLEPVKRSPIYVSKKDPYSWLNAASPTTQTTQQNIKVYQLPADACAGGFNNKQFKATTISTESQQSFDSCYVTQTIVYFAYDGSCKDGSNIEVSVQYSSYTNCDKSWMLKLALALEICVIVVGVPMALGLTFLALPTAWRIVSRPFVYMYLATLPKHKEDIKIKRQLRMEVDAHERWKWWRTWQTWPPMARLLRFRKWLVYCCVTVHNPNGRSRLLQVMVVSMCTVSVCVMVWRPHTYLILNSNPSDVALQLADQHGPLAALGRYFTVVALSLFLGCLGYLALLANINVAGTEYWSTQLGLSIFFLSYLSIILSLQVINLAAFTSIIQDGGAYVWIVVVQIINITTACCMQVRDLLTVSKSSARLTKPASASTPQLSSAAAPSSQSLPSDTTDENNVCRATSLTPVPHSTDMTCNMVQVSPVTKDCVKVEIHNDSKQFQPQDQHPVNPSISGSQQPADIRVLRTAPSPVPSKPLKVWYLLKQFLITSVFEEQAEFRDKATGKMLPVYTFRYPTWFLAAVLVAFDMLVFHFGKSLSWAERWGNCVINPDLCDSSDFIAKWATILNSEQIATARVGYDALRRQLNALQGSKDVVNQILVANGGEPLDKWQSSLDQVDHLMEPTHQEWASWKELYGEKLKTFSTLGFTLGLMLGLTTLFQAMRSYKEIVKHHRVLKILNRLKQAQDGRIDSNKTDCMGLSFSNPHDKAAYKAQVLQNLVRPRQSITAGVVAHESSATATQLALSRSVSPGIKTTNPDARGNQDVFGVTSVAAVRALNSPIGPVVFFIGVLLSSTVVQLYAVGTILSVALAFIFHPAFWQVVVARYWAYLVIAIIILMLNSLFVLRWVGNTYLSDGDRIRRPAGWFAFLIVASITNLVLGLLLAIIRLVLLLLTTIFTIGMLDRSLLTVNSRMDLPHRAFLAGVHLQNTLTDMRDPAYRPGPRGRAVKRWRAAAAKIVKLGPEGFENLVHKHAAEPHQAQVNVTNCFAIPVFSQSPAMGSMTSTTPTPGSVVMAESRVLNAPLNTSPLPNIHAPVQPSTSSFYPERRVGPLHAAMV